MFIARLSHLGQDGGGNNRIEVIERGRNVAFLLGQFISFIPPPVEGVVAFMNGEGACRIVAAVVSLLLSPPHFVGVVEDPTEHPPNRYSISP